MPEVPSKFKAWAAMDVDQGKALNVVPYEYDPKTWTEDDVDIKVDYSCVQTPRSASC